MAWKKIPPEADYFHCEAGSEYFLCEEGFVIEGRYLQDENVNLDKAIWPTVQGNRAYIRVRRKGVDKKFQLVRMLVELFPELLGTEVSVRTRKGPFCLHIEAESREAAPVAARTPSPRPRKEKPVRREREPAADPATEVESEQPLDEDEDEDALIAADVRLCKVCNLRKRVSEFSPRDDMCMDCYMGRDELLKEIIARRRRKTKTASPRTAEGNADGSSGDEGLNSFGRMDFGISLPE